MSLSNPIQRDTRERFVTVASGQSVFGPFDFKIYDPLDVAIMFRTTGFDPWSDVDGFTVTLTAAAPAFFTVTKAGLPTGTQLRIRGQRVHERENDVTRGGNISALAVEKQFDQITVILQELARDVPRAVTAENAAQRALSMVEDLTFGGIPEQTKAELRDRSTHTGPEPNGLTISAGAGAQGGRMQLAKAPSSTLPGNIVVENNGNLTQVYSSGGNGFQFNHDLAAPNVIHNMRTVADGRPWPLLSFISGALHTNILNGTHTGDLHTQIQSALSSGEDIDLPKSGLAKITNSINFIRQGQRLCGPSSSPSTGFRFYCDAGFNLAAPHVLAGVPYSHVENVFILFDQPSTATSKAQLRQYPWAMSARAAQRSQWRNIGWGGAYNGFDGRGIDLTNHPGGVFIHRVQDGALNIGGQFQDLYDFIDIDGWHGWEFGYDQLTNVRNINYSEPKYLIFGQNIEALQVGRVHLWMMTLVNQGTSLFKRSFGSVKLDGWASKFEWQNGKGTVAQLDILCDKNTAHNIVEVQGGDCTIASANLRDVSAHTSPMVLVTGGRCVIAAGEIQATGNGHAGEVTGGELEIGKVKVTTGGNTARTLPFFKRTGSAGKLTILGASTDARGTGSGDFVALEGGAGGNRIENCDYGGYRHNAVTAVGNVTVGNLNVGAKNDWSYAVPSERTHAQLATSTTQMDIAEIYLDASTETSGFAGGTIEIFSEGLIQGVGAAAAGATIRVVRQNGAALSAPAVTNASGTGVGSLALTAVLSGNTVIIRATFSAASTGSYLRHFMRVSGGNVRLKLL